MDDAPVKPGDLLGGKYRVESVLGSGSMGVIVAAEHIELAQRVALKFLLPSAIQSGEAASRFLREARAAVKIESEHVARVLDVGRLEQGSPYLVMEFLEGADLSTHPRGEAVSVEVALDYVLQACAGMAVAHSVGVIHRDLKPANLFLTTQPDGSPLVKVLDFGISKVSLMEASPELTQVSAFMGSPVYMSPEQAQSPRSVDARTDIWSLGVILYELLTGVPPFAGETLREVITALLTAEPKPMRRLRPSVPEGLDRAVLRALEKPVDRRYADIGEFSAALVEFAAPGSRVLHERVARVLQRARLSAAPGIRATYPSFAPPPADTPTTPELVPKAPALPTSLPPPPLPSGQVRALPLIATAAGWVARTGIRGGRRTSLALGASIGLLGALVVFFLLSRAEPQDANARVAASLEPNPAAFAEPSSAQVPRVWPGELAESAHGPRALPPTGRDATSAAATSREDKGAKRARGAKKNAKASSDDAAPTVPATKEGSGARCNPPYFFKAGIKTYRPECL